MRRERRDRNNPRRAERRGLECSGGSHSLGMPKTEFCCLRVAFLCRVFLVKVPVSTPKMMGFWGFPSLSDLLAARKMVVPLFGLKGNQQKAAYFRGSYCASCPYQGLNAAALPASAQPSAQRLRFDCKQQSWASGDSGMDRLWRRWTN